MMKSLMKISLKIKFIVFSSWKLIRSIQYSYILKLPYNVPYYRHFFHSFCLTFSISFQFHVYALLQFRGGKKLSQIFWFYSSICSFLSKYIIGPNFMPLSLSAMYLNFPLIFYASAFCFIMRENDFTLLVFPLYFFNLPILCFKFSGCSFFIANCSCFMDELSYESL